MTLTTRPNTPASVKVAFWVLLVSIVLDLLTVVLTLLSVTVLAVADRSLEVDGETLSGPLLFMTPTLRLMIAIVQLTLLGKLRRGDSRVRIFFTALEGISLLGLTTHHDTFDIAAATVGVVAIALLWLPASNAFFRRR